MREAGVAVDVRVVADVERHGAVELVLDRRALRDDRPDKVLRNFERVRPVGGSGCLERLRDVRPEDGVRVLGPEAHRLAPSADVGVAMVHRRGWYRCRERASEAGGEDRSDE